MADGGLIGGAPHTREFVYVPDIVENNKFEFGKRGANMMSKIKQDVRNLEKRKEEERQRKLKQADADRRQAEARTRLLQQQLKDAEHERLIQDKAAKWETWKAKKQADVEKKKRGDDTLARLKAEASKMKKEEVEKKEYLKEHARLSKLEKQLEDRLDILQRAKQGDKMVLMSGLGAVNSYSISYIRQRGRRRRAGDISLLYEDSDAPFISREENTYKKKKQKDKEATRMKRAAKRRQEEQAKKKKGQAQRAAQMLVLMPNGARKYVDAHTHPSELKKSKKKSGSSRQQYPSWEENEEMDRKKPGGWERRVDEIERARMRHKQRMKETQGGKTRGARSGTFGTRHGAEDNKYVATLEMEVKWKQRLQSNGHPSDSSHTSSAPALPKPYQKGTQLAHSTTVPGLHLPSIS